MRWFISRRRAAASRSKAGESLVKRGLICTVGRPSSGGDRPGLNHGRCSQKDCPSGKMSSHCCHPGHFWEISSNWENELRCPPLCHGVISVGGVPPSGKLPGPSSLLAVLWGLVTTDRPALRSLTLSSRERAVSRPLESPRGVDVLSAPHRRLSLIKKRLLSLLEE